MRSDTRVRAVIGIVALVVAGWPGAGLPQPAQAPIEYLLSFPEPHQRWMQVEMTVQDLGPRPLRVRMSRSSPGRYAVHEFAKNVWDVAAVDGVGQPLAVVRAALQQWDVAGHDGRVTLRYKVYGDRVDGTYLAVDPTHAHVNVPAALMYARDLPDRGARLTLRQPAGKAWIAATQLFPTADPLVFTAPNLAYLMDSPIEFGEIAIRTFAVPGLGSTPPQAIRVAMHHQGTEAQLDAYVRNVEKIVRELQGVFGELPAFEPGHYTFLVDYLPWASGDGMEHRNSTVVTSSTSLATGMPRLLGTVAHEFVHAWNVERIRPASLEPFSYEDANLSGDLWFAEGVSSYVDGVAMVRAGLTSFEELAARAGGMVNALANSPGTKLRSAVEMSQTAPFVDAATSVDRTNWDNTYLSYYAHGAAIGLALDLELRTQSAGRVGLDDYLRALWIDFGTPAAPAPGLVARPYTLRDLRDTLAAVSGSPAFAGAFFDRHVEGRQPPDWARLFAGAGLTMRKSSPGRATLGDVRFDFSQQHGKVSSPTPFESPAARAGLAQDDVVESLGGRPIVSAASLRGALAHHHPGETVSIVFTRRHGERVQTTVSLAEDPEVDVVPVERAGGSLSDAQRRLRDGWLASRAR